MTKTMCNNCIHFWGVSLCEAFPDEPGIPEEIIAVPASHSKPMKNQVGVFVYTPIFLGKSK